MRRSKSGLQREVPWRRRFRLVHRRAYRSRGWPRAAFLRSVDKRCDHALRLDSLNRWNGVTVAGQQRNLIDPVLDCRKSHVEAHHRVDTLPGIDTLPDIVWTSVFFAPLLTRVIRGDSPGLARSRFRVLRGGGPMNDKRPLGRARKGEAFPEIRFDGRRRI